MQEGARACLGGSEVEKRYSKAARIRTRTDKIGLGFWKDHRPVMKENNWNIPLYSCINFITVNMHHKNNNIDKNTS